MRPIRWLGDSLNIVRALPPEARHQVGTELRYVQRGEMPSDWKPMAAVGAGVYEIRVKMDKSIACFMSPSSRNLFTCCTFSPRRHSKPRGRTWRWAPDAIAN